MQASHVLIHGHPFPIAEKAPFMQSGQSLLGAIEYDEALDQTKCHECGAWLNGLGNHIRAKHSINKAEYNRLHGLRPSSPISSLGTRAKHRVVAKQHGGPGRGVQSREAREAVKRSTIARTGKSVTPRVVENHNLKARCTAQMLFRIQVLAATIGHTPTHQDIRECDQLSLGAIESRFGGTDEAMIQAGLDPNTNNRLRPLPNDFPSRAQLKKKWEEEMPWPEDYFSIQPRSGSSLS